MTARTFAAICGGLYLALGVLGFVPAVWERPGGASGLTIRVFYASLFGLLTVNIILSMIHLVIGLWGVMAANNKYSAVVFARVGAVVFLVLGVAGIIPIQEVNTAYGTVPLYGYNAVLHIATAVIAVFFAVRPGYALTQIGMQDVMNPHRPST
jgi:hypothetical protein